MQPALFYDDIYDALRDVVQALGGPKSVGVMLWPDKSVAMAHTALLNCLDRNRPEKLDLTQLVLLLKKGREVGCHAGMQFIAAECSYEAPRPIEPEDELAKLQREYIEAVNRLSSLAPKIEQVQAKLRTVA